MSALSDWANQFCNLYLTAKQNLDQYGGASGADYAVVDLVTAIIGEVAALTAPDQQMSMSAHVLMTLGGNYSTYWSPDPKKTCHTIYGTNIEQKDYGDWSVSSHSFTDEHGCRVASLSYDTCWEGEHISNLKAPFDVFFNGVSDITVTDDGQTSFGAGVAGNINVNKLSVMIIGSNGQKQTWTASSGSIAGLIDSSQISLDSSTAICFSFNGIVFGPV